ncbi:MAG: ABC transporter permease [Gemmatimonadales bacterium]|nr:ABC transporter permease [Gemmatimonadales bacterium]
MLGFLARRLALAALTTLAVVTITFTVVHLAPGEPMLGDAERLRADPATIARQRAAFGLDRPLPVQYALYLGNLARGELGESFVRRRPAGHVLRDALPNTLLLGGAALALSFLIGLATGTLQAARRGTFVDGALSVASLAAYSTPSFWLGLVLLLVFGQWLRWLPVSGMTDPVVHEFLSPARRALDVLRHLVLPATTLGLVNAAWIARFQRSALVDALGSPFVRTARAKGIAESQVLLKHALRNALAPVITLAGLSVPALLTGSVLVESVFGWPGMGRVTFEAIFARDYNVITAAAIVAGILVALANLLADLAVAVTDPRERLDA